MKTNIQCENFRGIAVNDSGDTYKIAQLRCKQWHCPYCARQNALQWRAAIIDYINKNSEHVWSFTTITAPQWTASGNNETRYFNSLMIFQTRWDKLMKRIRRYAKPEKIQYVRVLETHKNDRVHAHLLASFYWHDSYAVTRKDGSTYNRSSTLEKMLRETGFGYIHDARNLIDDDGKWHAGSVAGYVTKYITDDGKMNDELRRKKRVRKIQTSRGIKRVNNEGDGKWRLRAGLPLDEFERLGMPVHDVTTGHVVTREYFRGGSVYPPDDNIDS